MDLQGIGVPQHIGMVVSDAARAKDELGEVLGLQWDWYPHTPLTWRTGTGDVLTEVSVAYSTQGSPHLELIEEHSGGLFAAPGMHHIGFLVPDVRTAARRMEARGLTVSSELLRDGVAIAAYLDNPFGLVIELAVPDIRTRLATG